MSVYSMITDRIVDQLERGTVPWRKPWKTALPKNLVTKKPYRGINLLVLGISEQPSPFWATFRQINSLGGRVRKGEHGTIIVYTSWMNIEDEATGDEKEIPFLRYYRVFNLDQTVGIAAPDGAETTPFSPIERCERIVASMENRPTINFDGGDRAFYRPISDSIHLPIRERFDNPEAFYATAYHELVHSTGHWSRLGRRGITESEGFGTAVYSQEELLAEIGAAFLCGQAGIANKTLNASASYVDGWLKTLKADKRLVVVAAAQAQKAVDFITGCHSNPPE